MTSRLILQGAVELGEETLERPTRLAVGGFGDVLVGEIDGGFEEGEGFDEGFAPGLVAGGQGAAP